MTGKVWLVGAGPGDRGLFTLKGLEVLQNAEVVVYDALVGDEVLTLIPEDAETINVGKRAGSHRMEQEQINQILLDQALAGKRIVRLKGGDPFLFGRGGEELELLAQNDVPYEVVPGVSSALAVPTYNGIPVTHRDFTASVHIITGHRRSSRDTEGLGIDFDALVRTKGTLIFLMGLSTLPIIMKGLLDAGMNPDTPAAVLEKGTTAGQRRLVASVATLSEEAARAGMQAPAIIVAGQVCSLAESFAWAEKRPLAGKKILLTRPKELISEMAARLRTMGAEVLEMPAIETVPIEPVPRLDACMAGLAGAGRLSRTDSGGSGACIPQAPDWIIFTSPTGVRIFMDRLLKEQDIRALAGIRIAVIGQGSAKKLRSYGIRADFMPSVYDGETLGRELAQKIRPARGPVRILIPRAAIGSRDLVDELEKAGNVVIEDVPTYETRYAAPELIDIRKKIREGEIDYAVFTSASTVRGFSAAMKDADLSGIPMKAICIGRQTGAAADSLGLETRMAKKATLEALVEAVLDCAKEKQG